MTKWTWTRMVSHLVAVAVAMCLLGGVVWAQPPVPQGYWGPTTGVPVDYPNFGWNPQSPKVNWTQVRSWWNQPPAPRTITVRGTGDPAELASYLDRWFVESAVPTATGVLYTLREIIPSPIVVPAAVIAPQNWAQPQCCPVSVPWWQMPVGCVKCTTG